MSITHRAGTKHQQNVESLSLMILRLPVVDLSSGFLFLQEPRQLLAIFSRLEAQNLIVIQGMQDASAALEEAKTRQEHQKARLDTEWLSLQSQVLHLKETKTRTQEICSALKVTALIQSYLDAPNLWCNYLSLTLDSESACCRTCTRNGEDFET